jgi:hypothetical protein
MKERWHQGKGKRANKKRCIKLAMPLFLLRGKRIFSAGKLIRPKGLDKLM